MPNHPGLFGRCLALHSGSRSTTLGDMKNYISPSIRDLGAVADLTQGFVNGPLVDGVRFLAPSSIGPVVVNGTLSGVASPFPIAPAGT